MCAFSAVYTEVSSRFKLWSPADKSAVTEALQILPSPLCVLLSSQSPQKFAQWLQHLSSCCSSLSLVNRLSSAATLLLLFADLLLLLLSAFIFLIFALTVATRFPWSTTAAAGSSRPGLGSSARRRAEWVLSCLATLSTQSNYYYCSLLFSLCAATLTLASVPPAMCGRRKSTHTCTCM